MKATNDVIGLIKNRFRHPSMPKINQSQLADHMGLGKAWVSKLMNGKIHNLTEEHVEKIEEFIGIRLSAYSDKTKTPAAAVELARKMQDSEPFARIVSALLELSTPSASGTRWIQTQDMTKIGQEIIRLAFANEDKPGKVAREVLKLLS